MVGGQPEGRAPLGGPRRVRPHRRRRHHPRRFLRDPKDVLTSLIGIRSLSPPGPVAKGVAVTVDVRGLTFGYGSRPSPACASKAARSCSIVKRAENRLSSSSWAASCRRERRMLDGRALSELKSAQARARSWLCPSGAHPGPELPGAFVLMGRAAFAATFSVPSREDRRLAEEAVRFVGLDEHRGPGVLPAERREAETRSRRPDPAAQRPEVFLLDEPTFLDPKHEVEVMELCRKLAAEKGKTSCITLHNLEMASSIRTRWSF